MNKMSNYAIVHTYYFVNENKVKKADYKRIKSVLSTWDKDYSEEITRIRLGKTTFIVNYLIKF